MIAEGELKRCAKCHSYYDLSCFPINRHFKDGYSNYCRDCTNENNRQYKHDKDYIRKEELPTIIRLNSEGISTLPGKHIYGMKRIDCVAFGCIKIEIRTSKFHAGKGNFGQYMWKVANSNPNVYHAFTNNHFIILSQQDNGDDFYILSPFNKIFYHTNGELKLSVGYNPYSRQKRGSQGKSMDFELMQQYRNRFDFIKCFLQDMISCGDFTLENRYYGI